MATVSTPSLNGDLTDLRIDDLITQLHVSGRNYSPVADVVAPLAALLVLRWAAFMEAEQEAVASFDDAVFTAVLPGELSQSAWHSPSEVAPRVGAALEKLDEHGNNVLLRYVRAIAPIVRYSAERDPQICDALAMWVARLEFETAEGRDRAAGAFDRLLARVIQTQGKHGGEFTTPRSVVELMVQLAEPSPGDRVYDPCFGVGGLLVEAARRLRSAAVIGSVRQWDHIRSNGIFGVEINPTSFAIGLCRVLLAGIDRPGLELGDALERPLPRNRAIEGFDCILASPPWGSRVPESNARQYPVQTGGIENLFLQHVMANLRPGGRAVIALPEATLFRTGPDKQVRKALTSEFRVEGVVSLPAGAFAPCTNIQSNLVVFRRDPPRSSVRFIQISSSAWPTTGAQGFGDGGYGEASADGAGVGYGEYGYGTSNGDGHGDGRPLEATETSPALREISTIFRQEGELSPKELEVSGIDAWEVPLRTLATRDYELIAKHTGTEQLEAMLERALSAEPGLQVLALEQIAEVSQGVSYDRKVTSDRGGRDVLAPLVRVGDIVDPQIKKPSLFFTTAAAPRIRQTHRLCRGDVLMTTSGTVGKIGVVDDDQDLVGAVATKSLVLIRPQDSSMSAFIAALLRSPGYQEWLQGHARGSTIQHLSVRTLRKLPIPVPAVQVQTAVLRNLSRGADALALLTRYITGGSADPLATWLERPGVVTLLSDKGPPSEAAKQLSNAGRELQELRPLRNKVAHSLDSTMPDAVTRWVLDASEIAPILVGIDSVPLGSPRLAALELARVRVDAARRSIGSDESPMATRLRAVTTVLGRLAEEAVASMLTTVSLTFRVDPSEIVIGAPTEIELAVRNGATAGLRNLRVTTRPDVGTGDVAYLPESGLVSVPLTVQANAVGEPLRIAVRWTALRLDGVLVQGEDAVDIHVRSTRDALRARDLGPSPYIVGNPIDREEMFYGRADIIERIRRQLGSTINANVILLEGNRRTGKTSILKQLQKKGELPGWLIVYCNFQEAEGDETRAGISTRDVYRFMARAIGWALFSSGIRTWFPGEPGPDAKRPFPLEFLAARDRAISDAHPFESFEIYLRAALEAARPHRVLIMLDEFDKLQEGIDAGVTSPQVPENIRHILQHHAGLSAILTGSRRLKRLREEYWSALFGLGYRVGISSLPLEDARRLVTEPVAERLNYLPQARDRVVELCARQPFLVQSLCNRIFERADESDERTITTSVVNEAAVEMVHDNEHFRTLWGYARTHRRRLLLALCERLADGPDAVNLDLLYDRVEAVGVHVSRQSLLGDDLEYLRELELIEFDKSYRGGTYRIAIPLLGMWIQSSIDFDDTVARAREEEAEGHR